MTIDSVIMVFGLVDSHGGQWVGASEDYGDVVSVWNLRDEDGDPLHFSDEACNLEEFAKQHGLRYGEKRLGVSVDVE